MSKRLFTLRIFVGAVFAVSGFLKLLQPYQNFLAVIQTYQVLPPAFATAAAIALPWAEFLLGVFLVLGLWTRPALACLWALNTSFIALLVSAIARRLPIQDCGCFGDWIHLSPQQTLGIDIVLWSIFALLWKRTEDASRMSLDSKMKGPSSRQGSGSSSPAPVRWLLLVLIVGTAWFLGRMTAPAAGDPVLAQVGPTLLRESQLDPGAAAAIRDLSVRRKTLAARSAESWAETMVLTKEALARSMPLERFLQQEVVSRVRVDEREVMRRYALSPEADAVSFDEATRKIRDGLAVESAKARRRELAESLYQKYQAKFPLGRPTPEPNQPPYPLFSHRFGPELKEGRVVGAPSLGPASAPVVLEVFSDFFCPFSARFVETMKKVSESYPDKVRIEFRHFPLPMHAGADLAAEASLCAQEQGKFWPYHDALYAKVGAAKDKIALTALAKPLGVDVASFEACLGDGRYKKRVALDIAEGKKRGVQGTPSFFVNGRMNTGAQPFEALSKKIDWTLDPKGPIPSPPAPPRAAQQAAAAPQNVSFSADELAGAPSKGPSSAPVTIVEFMDYNCPFCQRGHAVMKEVEKNFAKDVRFVSKQFPLPIHPNAKTASVAALCADQQGRYWEFRDRLFGEAWGKQSAEDMKASAKALGLDEKKFSLCLDSDEIKARVDKDAALGSSKGVSGTPTFFVDGQRIVGAQPYAEFEKTIREKLKK